MMPSAPAARIPGNSKGSSAPATKVDQMDDNLDTSGIPVHRTVATKKAQFPNSWNVRSLEATLSDLHNTSMFDRENVKRITDIGGRIHRW